MRPTPSLLIQHEVVDDAADRKLGILLDGVVLEVLVAAVAIEHEAPLRISLADAAEEAQAECRAFDVERLVVLEHAQGFLQIERLGARVDRLEEEAEAQSVEELVGLRDIGTTRIEHERLESRWRHAEAPHRVVHHEEHRSAVDAPEKQTPIGAVPLDTRSTC